MKRIMFLAVALLLVTVCAESQKLTVDAKSRLYGYKDADGKWLVSPIYQRAFDFVDGDRPFAVVKYDDRWGCIDVQGNMIVRNLFTTREEAEAAGHQWRTADDPGKWVYPVMNPVDHKWGYVNYYGQWKFQPQYQAAGFFRGTEPMCCAAVMKDDRWGCIDTKGVMVVASVFNSQEDAEAAGMQWMVGRHYGTWRMAVSDPVSGSWGVADYLGHLVVSCKYSFVDRFGEDHNHVYAQVRMDDAWGNIDRNGNEISACVFQSKAEANNAMLQLENGRNIAHWRYPAVTATGKWGWVNFAGEWVIDPVYEGASHFANDTGDFATAKVDRRWAVITADGTLLSEPVFNLSDEAWQAGNEWDTHKELGDWLYPVYSPDMEQWGYVNYKGAYVIPPVFEDARLFMYSNHNRVAPAKQEGRWGCIDHTGRFVVQCQFNSSSDAAVAGRKWAERHKY